MQWQHEACVLVVRMNPMLQLLMDDGLHLAK
jgi:hypothetical protein